jgi:hypothetical protein
MKFLPLSPPGLRAPGSPVRATPTHDSPSNKHLGTWRTIGESVERFLLAFHPQSPNGFFAWTGNKQPATSARGVVADVECEMGVRSMALDFYDTAPNQSERAHIGSATLTFATQDKATLSFRFTDGGLAGRNGVVGLARVGGDD